MTAMPPLVRVIAMLLIGLPGGVLWVGGMISILLSSFSILESTASRRLEPLLVFGVSVMATGMGFAMVTCVEILNGAKHYQMPGNRLPAYLGLELLEVLLMLASVCGALAMLATLAQLEPLLSLLWTCFEAATVTLLVTTTRTRKSKGKKWREELLIQAPPPDLEAGS